MMIKNKVVEKNVCKKIVKLKLFGKVILITSSKRAPFYVIYVNNVSCIYIRLCIHTQIEYLIVHIYTNILKPRRQKNVVKTQIGKGELYVWSITIFL